MGFNFRKSFKIAPGVRLNVGKKGISSVSVGGKGARVSLGKKGTRTTVSAPGTGLSYSSYKPHKKSAPSIKRQPDFSNPDNFLGYPKSEWIVSAIIGFIILIGVIWIVS
ncbi:hypothetical protein F891_01871 [Acinetobacter sp. CIP 101966]|jgi:hypothetical protein|uniref:DUF4236 domain-containing protein n=1 Tax=Acinetobacter sp. CIP 101966 TaxID=1144662 RepID=UPI0002CDE68C|nr:DUF4236 domain-containing protein [Acinetobacter sp. CIP 101966]ENX26918.1 hypothetical protein F891_01871 [Acinetobacter sp. CIP 101966]